MHNTSNFHSQRPEYQRENIDLALKSIKKLLEKLDIDINAWDFDPNKIIYSFFDDIAGFHSAEADRVEIAFLYSFDISTLIHELLHAFSSSRIHGNIGISGINHFISSENRGKYFSINEGITDLMTFQIVSTLRVEIIKFKEKYGNLAQEYQDLKSTGVNKPHIFTEWIRDNGWYSGYEEEVKLIEVIIDFLGYIMSQNDNICFEKSKNEIWLDIMSAYFTGDTKLFEKILEPLKKYSGIHQSIKDFQEENKSEVFSIISEIENEIWTNYDSRYTYVSSVPRTLALG